MLLQNNPVNGLIKNKAQNYFFCDETKHAINCYEFQTDNVIFKSEINENKFQSWLA